MNKEEIERLLYTMVWKTQDGRITDVENMDTKHIFNCMKMYYNHCAATYGLPTVWFNNLYSDHFDQARKRPERMAKLIIAFIYEILRRGDLPSKYMYPFECIIQNLKGLSKTKQDLDDAILLLKGRSDVSQNRRCSQEGRSLYSDGIQSPQLQERCKFGEPKESFECNKEDEVSS